MAIHQLLANPPLRPEEIDVLAYEDTLRGLYWVDRDDPIAKIVAKKVIEIAHAGLRDPAQISAQAIKELGTPSHLQERSVPHEMTPLIHCKKV